MSYYIILCLIILMHLLFNEPEARMIITMIFLSSHSSRDTHRSTTMASFLCGVENLSSSPHAYIVIVLTHWTISPVQTLSILQQYTLWGNVIANIFIFKSQLQILLFWNPIKSGLSPPRSFPHLTGFYFIEGAFAWYTRYNLNVFSKFMCQKPLIKFTLS